jgi:hypothetical protein
MGFLSDVTVGESNCESKVLLHPANRLVGEVNFGRQQSLYTHISSHAIALAISRTKAQLPAAADLKYSDQESQ